MNDPMRKWANELSRVFSKEKVQKKKTMKKCSMSLALKEIKIKTRLRSKLFSLLVEWLSSRTQTTANIGKEMGKKETSYTAGRNVN
jgi:hypothetical protein